MTKREKLKVKTKKGRRMKKEKGQRYSEREREGHLSISFMKSHL